MSHMAGGGARYAHPGKAAGAENLQTSNRTSGYFLGTRPRDWMLHNQAANTIPVANRRLARRTSDHVVNTAPSSNVTRVRLQNSEGETSSSTTHPPSPPISDLTDPPVSTEVNVASRSTLEDEDYTRNQNALTINANASAGRLVAEVDNTPVNVELCSPAICESPLIENTSSVSTVPDQLQRRHRVSLCEQMPIAQRQILSGAFDSSSHGFGHRRRLLTANNPRQSTTLAPATSNTTSLAALPTALPPIPAVTYPQAQLLTPHTPGVPASPPLIISQQHTGQQGVRWRLPNAAPAMLLQNLNSRLSSLFPTPGLDPAKHIRVSWLRAACQYGDIFYLILHQFVSIQAALPSFLASYSLFLPDHNAGLGLLDHVLGDSHRVAPEIGNIFCNFVTPLTNVPTDQSLQSWMPIIKAFLKDVRRRWENLKIQILARGWPPSASEIASGFGSDSRVLSQAIYTNLFYQIFPGAFQPFAQQAFRLFVLDQDAFLQRKQRGLQQPIHNGSRGPETSAFVDRFHQIVRHYNQRPLQFLDWQLAGGANRSPQQLSLTQLNYSTNTTLTTSPETMAGNVFRIQGPMTTPAQPIRASISHSLAGASLLGQPDIASRIFPAPGQFLPIVANPNPNRSALHQAHLSGPRLVPDIDTGNAQYDGRLYAYLESLVGEPRFIDQGTVYETWSTKIPEEVFKRRVVDDPAPQDNIFGRSARKFHNGSVLFHLRCIQVPTTDLPLNQTDFSAISTNWPENIFISMNDIHLEFRRKIHHGRDQPVDITHLVERTSNELQLSYLTNTVEAAKKFALVFEVVTIVDHAAASRLPTSIDAPTSLASIVQSLQTTIEDEDIILADSHVSIDLIDPFSARIFDKPVRGATCRHRECFDLESYLQSRSCRDKDGLVQPDEWKCPLCGKDARPTNLVLDHFLLEVKARLVTENKTNTRAILVTKDGDWEPKVEGAVASDSHDHRDSLEPQSPISMLDGGSDGMATKSTPAQVLTPLSNANEPQIVDLIDDDY